MRSKRQAQREKSKHKNGKLSVEDNTFDLTDKSMHTCFEKPYCM